MKKFLLIFSLLFSFGYFSRADWTATVVNVGTGDWLPAQGIWEDQQWGKTPPFLSDCMGSGVTWGPRGDDGHSIVAGSLLSGQQIIIHVVDVEGAPYTCEQVQFRAASAPWGSTWYASTWINRESPMGTISIGGGTVMTNVTWQVKNDRPWKEQFTLTDPVTGNSSSLSLDPGQSGTVQLSVPMQDGVTGTSAMDPSVYNSNFDSTYTNQVYSLGAGSNPTNGQPIFQQVNSDGMTNGPLMWSSNSSTPAAGASLVYDPTVNKTLQEGFNKQFADNELSQTLMQQQENTLLALMATGRVTTVVVSNTLSGLVITNNLILGSTGVLGNLNFSNLNLSLSTSNLATEATLDSISNILGGDLGTNFDSGTNLAANLGLFTNYDDAMAALGGPQYTGMAAIGNWFTTTIAGIIVPTIDEGGTISSSMVLVFPGTGYQIDFNPLSNSGVVGIFYYAKMLIQWLLVVYYLKRCLVDSRWAIQQCTESRTGSK